MTKYFDIHESHSDADSEYPGLSSVEEEQEPEVSAHKPKPPLRTLQSIDETYGEEDHS